MDFSEHNTRIQNNKTCGSSTATISAEHLPIKEVLQDSSSGVSKVKSHGDCKLPSHLVLLVSAAKLGYFKEFPLE
jgi:hypothetical protein